MSMKFGFIVAAAVMASSSAMAQTASEAVAGDPVNGEKVFKRCAACHMVGENAKTRVGPVLNGVVDAEVAHLEDYKYSKALLDLKEQGMTWTVENLTAWLRDPKGFAPGTKMVFAGLKKDEEIADVIAYLATFPGPTQ